MGQKVVGLTSLRNTDNQGLWESHLATIGDLEHLSVSKNRLNWMNFEESLTLTFLNGTYHETLLVREKHPLCGRMRTYWKAG